jgi:hypothetical protein
MLGVLKIGDEIRFRSARIGPAPKKRHALTIPNSPKIACSIDHLNFFGRSNRPALLIHAENRAVQIARDKFRRVQRR